MKLHATTPPTFNDSLPVRAKQTRFRGIGNPYEFLNSIGIVPIQERLFRGANIIDVADELNVPLTLIHTWIEENNYTLDIEKASRISAEGYIYQGEQLLKNATNKFELDKAKVMLEHGRFMASKKDKKTYGNTPEEKQQSAGVTYIFNIPNSQDPLKDAKKVIDLTSTPQTTLEDKAEFHLTIEADAPPAASITQPRITNIKPLPEGAEKEVLSDVDKWVF